MLERLEFIVAKLEATRHYRVVRRFECPECYAEDDSAEKHLGVFLDLETTGTDFLRDEIIELAMVPFEFAPDGRIFRILPAFTRLNNPGRPLDPFITQLTGITDEMPPECSSRGIGPRWIAR